MKKAFAYILLGFHVFFTGNISLFINTYIAHAAVGDIGHWRDSAGGQIPGTSFTGFNFNQQIRNDGIYTKPSNDTIQLNEAGDYLIIATTTDEDTSNGRYNSQLRVSQTAGTGELFTSHYSGYSRDNSENESWTRAISIIIGASANSQIQVQKRRDTDAPIGGSIINASDVQVIRLTQTNYGIYTIGGTGNVYGGTVPNTVSIDSVVSQSDAGAIEGNIATDTVTVKGDNKKYLVAWSTSFSGAGNRTQRIGHLDYDGNDILSTRSYCYRRNTTNEYCGLGSMDLIETGAADIEISAEVFRGPGTGADQGGADTDQTMTTDGNGQMIILEMPDTLEAFRSEDSTGLQDVTTAQTINFARDVNINDVGSFTKNSDSQISVTNPADIFSWSNIWTARGNTAAGQRQTSFGSIVIDGIEQSVGKHGSYSRGNQGSTDTFAMGFQPAGIYRTTGAGTTLGVNTDPLAGGEAGGNDRTQPGTVGFFALNLDTLALPVIDPAPGGISTNLALWLKADDGTSTTTDGAGLTTWFDQSGNALDATAVNAPIYRNNINDELNFNPVIDFNGTNQYLENLANGAYSDSYYIVIVPDQDVEGTSSQGVPFGFNCNSGVLSNGGPCGLDFGGLALGSFTVTIPDEVITHAIGSSANWRSSKTAVVTFPADKPMLIGVNDNPTSSITDIYEKGEQVNNATRNTYQTLSTADYTLGRAPDPTYPFYYDGKIAEVINYNDSLTTNERHKIESYLAIKYGITLNNGTQDYISTNDTTIWSTATNIGYNNNIFGIGRDTNQELGQVKSKSVNDGGVVIVEADGEGTNIANSFVDITDNEFLISGDNAGGNSWTSIDAPSGFSVLDRKWKTEETGDVGNVAFTFDVDDTNFDIPTLANGTTYHFIYDSDSDGSLADETPTPMVNTSGSNWESINFNISNGQIYTIATIASLNNIPTDIILSNDTSDENVISGTNLGSFTSVDLDIADTHTYTFVSGAGDDDNDRFTIVGSNINFNHSPDHEIQNSYTVRVETNDGNGGTYQEAFLISINDIGEANTSTIDLEDTEDEDKYTVGSGQWNNTTTNPNTGTNSLESDNLGLNNTQSCFQVEHNSNTDGFIDFFYSVSSQAGSDVLRFFIDNVQIEEWSGIIPYTQYTSIVQTPGLHIYKWCYVKDNTGSASTDNAYIDDINFINGVSDTIAPVISSTNFSDDTLLPGGNHNITINYTDADSGIDSSTANIGLFKWDGVSAYGPDISGSSISTNSITATSASYNTNNLDFGKYRYIFTIDDNAGNTATETIDFYIDIPEFTVSTPEIDLGVVNHVNNTFSDTVTVTVKTVGAGFDVYMNSTSPLLDSPEQIELWDGTTGFGYDPVPYSTNISTIGTEQNIGTQAASINTNGDKNTYTFDIKLGALIDEFQASGDYEGNIDIGVIFDY